MRITNDPPDLREDGSVPVLHAPLRDHLHDPVTAAARARVADRLFRLGAKSSGTRNPRATFTLGHFVTAGTLTLLVSLVLLWPLEKAEQPSTLLTQKGTPFALLEGSGGPQRVTFQDGSVLAVRDGARVVSLASTERDFAVRLERGHLDVEVHPGGPRRWIIEAKLARVEVVGTKFSVTRAAASVAVVVQRGAVLVRSEYLTEGVVRLEAGEQLEIQAVEATSEPALSKKPEANAEPAENAESAEEGTEESSEKGTEETPGGRPAGTDRSEPVEKPPSEPSAAGGTAAPSPPDREQRSEEFERLREQADQARAAGQLDTAEALYAQLVGDHGSDPRVALVLYTWGVTSLQNGAPLRALRTFQAVMNKDPSKSLQEDTLLRLVELQLELNQGTAAAESAQQYATRFPQGRHLETIREMLKERVRGQRGRQ